LTTKNAFRLFFNQWLYFLPQVCARRWKPNDRIFKACTLGDDVLVESFRPWCKRQVGFHWRVRSNWTTLGRPTRFATRVDLSRCTL